MLSKREPFDSKLLSQIKSWPALPGVYVMKDKQGTPLYVGKAKNLRNRIKSYFHKDVSPKTAVLIAKIHVLEYTVTQTELEALLLECNLIKKYRPRYNIRLRDDKNYPYFVLDFTHPFPRFDTTRKVTVSPNLKYFGPYGAGIELSRFLYKSFQLRDCGESKYANRTRPCLNYEIGTCTAPCVGYVTQQAYGKQVQEAILFLKGKKKELLATLKKQMDAYSLKMEYERARNIRDKIFSVKKITEKQNVVLSNNQKDIDVVGYFSNGNEIQWVVLYVRAGLLTGRRTHRLKLSAESPETVIQTFLEQTYIHALIPDEIWIPTDFVERHSLEKLLSQRSQRDVKILVRRSENSLRLLGMAYENAKLIFEENKIETDPAIELQKTLGLKGPPIHIEGIDVSNLQIEAPVVSLVHFEQGRPDKSRYRLFYPKLVQSQNDFAMIYEGVLRRFKDMDNPAPDLLLIDGGKGQLQAAARALQEHSLNIPICALAKARTQHGFTRKELQKVQERIFLPNRKNPVLLNSGHPALCLLQQIRDEAHRFAIKGHRRRRSKSRLAESTLTQMRGIGQRTRQKLLKYFGGMDQISNASIDELKGAGITQSQAEAVYDLFHITPAGCT